MYNLATILPRLRSLIGFSQTEDPCYPLIHSDLLIGANKVATIANTWQVLKNEYVYDTVATFDFVSRTNLSGWGALVNYTIGSRIIYTIGSNDFVFVSLQNANLGNIPSFNSPFWESDLSAYYRFLVEASANEAFRLMVLSYTSKNNVSTILYNEPILEQRGNSGQQLAVLDNHFRAIVLNLSEIRDLSVGIISVSVYLDTPQTIRFYLYHTSSSLTVTFFDLVFTASEVNKWSWVSVPSVVDIGYLSEGYSGGAFLLGFYEDDIVGNCFETDYYPVRKLNNYKVRHYPAMIDNSMTNKPNAPTWSMYNSFAGSWRSPFNLSINVGFDFTKTILQSIDRVADAIRYDIAHRIISDEKNSNRKTNNHSHIQEVCNDILFDKFVEGGKVAEQGLVSQKKVLFDDLKLMINKSLNAAAPFFHVFG